MHPSLLILGSGSLAREIVLALVAVWPGLRAGTLSVTIGSRDSTRSEWLALLGRARAQAAGAAISFHSRTLHWSNAGDLAEVIASATPTALLHCTSLQSAWSLRTPNAWSQLVNLGGYGITTALQAAFLPALSRALAAVGYTGHVVNACYPDVLNAGAPRLGLKIACGLGNVALIAELLGAHFSARGEQLRMLAGHWDVNEFCRPAEERADAPLVWLNEQPLDPSALEHVMPLAGDVSMNALSAGASALMLGAMAAHRDLPTFHAPGPRGLMGGYPLRLVQGEVLLDLPTALNAADAIAWNNLRAQRDGALISDEGRLVFAEQAAQLLANVAPELSDGFDFADVESVTEAFVGLREHLITKPPSYIASR